MRKKICFRTNFTPQPRCGSLQRSPAGFEEESRGKGKRWKGKGKRIESEIKKERKDDEEEGRGWCDLGEVDS